jgi:hypothetical protein
MTGSIVCGVDDPAGGEEVVRVGRALAARLALPLVLVHAADGLVAAARTEDAVLIVISSEARSRLAAAAADVARRASCPVVVVPRGADRALATVEAGAARFPGLLDDGYGGGGAVARAG